MFAISKSGFGLNLVVSMPLAMGIAIVSTSLSTVQAQTSPNNSSEASTPLPENIAYSISSQSIAVEDFLDASQHAVISPESPNFTTVVNHPQPGSKSIETNLEDIDTTKLQKTNINTPMPGTTATSAATLSVQPSTPTPSVDRSAVSDASSSVEIICGSTREFIFAIIRPGIL